MNEIPTSSFDQLEVRAKEADRLEQHCRRVEIAVKKYIAGEPLSKDETYLERLLCEHREKEQAGRATVFATSSKEMPPLTVSYGSSGLEIRALMDKSFNCVEFATKENTPQPVLIAPWIQFEPADLSNERLRLVMEIARRAMAYDDMVKRTARAERLIEEWRCVEDRSREKQQKLIDMWRAERTAAGKPADFSDIVWSGWKE